jgi:pullulanase
VPASATIDERVRMQNLGISLIALGQGIPFFQAGIDMLRSKSGDGDSYNSGDWFNKLDFTYQSNNWGVGLPPEWRNKKDWNFWQPRLADKSLNPNRNNIVSSVAHFQKMLKIRKSSALFHLQSAEDVFDRVMFLEPQDKIVPGLIAMYISDKIEGKPDLDPDHKSVIAVFNATRDTVNFRNNLLINMDLKLFPVLTENTLIENSTGKLNIGADPLLKQTSFDTSTGTIVVPPRTTVVYYEPE